MSERTARLDELLREEISDVVRREVDDPRIGFVTITDVEVAPDLRHASVWVSVIGSADQRKQALRALSHAMPFVRSRLGRLRLKRIPELHVKEDQTAERGTRVLRILESLEEGGSGDVPEVEETLPTPTGISALDPVDEAMQPRPRRRRPRGRR
jgi:ribosome-binding factor A